MYKFTYASGPYISTPSAAVVQPALQKDPNLEFSFDSLLAMDSEGFTAFDSKTHGYYDLSDTYVEGGWSSGSSSAQTSTYHPSPIQYDQGHSEFGSDDSVISPISPTSTTFSGDVFNYVSFFWLNLKHSAKFLSLSKNHVKVACVLIGLYQHNSHYSCPCFLVFLAISLRACPSTLPRGRQS